MAGSLQRRSKRRWLLPGVICLLLGGGSLWVWKSYSPPTEPGKQTGLTAPSSGNHETLPPASAGQEPNRRSNRAEEPLNETAQRQMGVWLEDANVSPPEAARRIWRIATDPNYSQAVRKDALANSLNLADDRQFQEEFLGELSKKEIWSGDLGEALLDDLYNRDNGVKIAATAALLPEARGEFLEHLRDVLRFQLEAEDADDATLIRLATERTEKPEKSVGDE